MSDDRTSSNVATDADEVLQWVTFKLGEETYGINAGSGSAALLRNRPGTGCPGLCTGDNQPATW